jgi:hypothetical protein
MTTLSFLLAMAIGWLMVRCFDPLREVASGPRWARSLFRISLALVAGLGFTSLSFLLLRMAGVSRPPATAESSAESSTSPNRNELDRHRAPGRDPDSKRHPCRPDGSGESKRPMGRVGNLEQTRKVPGCI